MGLYLGESDERLKLSGCDGRAVGTLSVLAKLQVELLQTVDEELTTLPHRYGNRQH